MDIVINDAREPNDDFWKLSGILGPTKWTKDPFIVLQEKSGALFIKEQLAALAKPPTDHKPELRIHIIEKLADVLELPDECVVLKQWPGNWRSDFFKLTVGMLREKVALSATRPF